MLTLQDCIALSDLTEDEVAAVAEHEHLPQIIAAELGFYLVHREDGVPLLKRMIIDDIAAARRRGDLKHALKLRLVLHHFIQSHPETEATQAGDSRQAKEVSR